MQPVFKDMIAPCGMNCGICIGHLRKKKPCGGCFRMDDPNKPNGCRSCRIANCERLAQTESGFCNECEIFPCARLKQLDKRYREKYRMSMLENLAVIRDQGLDVFLSGEQARWTCVHCGEIRCVHRSECLHCGKQTI